MGAGMSAVVALVSLGCAKNLVDSEVMAGLLAQAGYRLTPDVGEADVVVVNTCGFIAPAQRESIDTVLTLSRLKQDGSLKALVVAGCLPRRFDGAQVAAGLPEVDAVIGTAELARLPEVIRRALAGERVVMVEDAPSFLYHDRMPRLLSTPSATAYVKIAEGCQHACTFCTIPAIRGPFQSRPMESIEDEVRGLAGRGVQEVVLIGQDTSMYGADRYGRLMLAELLRRLDRTGIRWVRLLYAHPSHVTPELMDVMAELPSVCHYLDIPLQHASGAVLRAMRRPGDRSTYERLIEALRARMPDLALRTTFMVGFPKETEADLADLLDFMSTVRFEHVGVFTFVREPGTPAARMDGAIPARERQRRRAVVMAHQQELLAQTLGRRVGARVPVLVERPVREGPGGPGKAGGGPAPYSWWVGRTAYQAPDVDGVTRLPLPAGHAPGMVDAVLERVDGYDFVASPSPGGGLGIASDSCYNAAAFPAPS